jgi:NADH dehydrogenase (ubiquinone) 1 alpha/beta subcomplex 1, acyl-carrier protein
MFRTALIRTAASASRMAARPVARATIFRPVAPVASRMAAFKAVRMYSAASGLKKEEVEGRIMGILQGFDKVNDTSNVGVPQKTS